MIFHGTDEQTVEFRITNYEFPDNIDGDWDSNWLLIYLNVKSKVGHWQTVDPSLTTGEVQQLIDWFKELANDKEPKWNPMNFTEPNLSFEYIDTKAEKKKIRIKFDYESRPQTADDNKEYFVECEWTNAELKQIADDLTNELKKFPKRTATTK